MAHDWYKHYPKNIPHEIDFSVLPSIAGVIAQTCERHPEAPAITCMGTTVSYRQLDRLASRFASYLQHELGLKKGDRFAIMVPNVLQFPVAFLGAQKLGVICVNTNPLYTPREMLHQFKDSGVTAIIILDLFLDKLEKIIKETNIKMVISTSIGDQLPFLKGTVIQTVLKIKKQIPKHSLPVKKFTEAIKIGAQKPHQSPSIGHDDLAILQYTGGTTGLSKGAMLTQKNILSNMTQIKAWAGEALSGGNNNVLTAIPLYHIFALSVNFLSFLMMGCHMYLVPKPVPIKNTVKMFEKYKINVMTGVNTLFNSMTHDPLFRKLAPKTIKIALAGGMALQESVSKSFQKITGVRIIEGFGLTESSPVVICNLLEGEYRIGSCGIPLPSTEAKIVDDNGVEVKFGEVGELVVRGPQVMRGYWNQDEDTRKTIKDGWLWTGDIAKRDADGFFYIVDRKKDMVIVSGFNVYPSEIEDVLSTHPKILESAVIGVKDSKAGEAVKAFIVKKDESLTEEEVREFCKEQLTNYKRPKFFEFRKELPKSNVGKIIRRELRG
jgi:long-chain acyl-CoA synthetase